MSTEHRTSLMREVRMQSAEVGDPIIATINHFALRELRAEDVAVFTFDLCNNQVDKHHSVFPEVELHKVAQMAVGRPLIEQHNMYDQLPRGTIFDARVETIGNVSVVRCMVYVLRTAGNADFIRSIEGGVYREISIGFTFRMPICRVCTKDIRTCEHVPGVDYEGIQCIYEMRDVDDVLEASVVTAGSQSVGFVGAERRREFEKCEVKPEPVQRTAPVVDAKRKSRIEALRKAARAITKNRKG